MAESTERNKRLLHFLCWSIQLVGWILIISGAVWFVMFVCDPANAKLADAILMETILTAASHFSFDFVFVGLVAVILSQLARYVFDVKYEAGFMLRSGDKILYLFAFLAIAWAWFKCALLLATAAESSLRFLSLILLIAPTIAKVLILVGLGQMLKRIIPVIEESRTLV